MTIAHLDLSGGDPGGSSVLITVLSFIFLALIVWIAVGTESSAASNDEDDENDSNGD